MNRPLTQEEFYFEETLRSHVDELIRMEGILLQIAKQIGLSEERVPLFIVAVTEALSNAILHGNRQDPQKQVRIRFRYVSSSIRPGGKLLVEVRDEGTGFDPSSLPDPTEEDNLLRESGRGIFLMRNLADGIEFKEGGRCVELRFDL
ncbi:MAG: ATP-binding protein [Bacteroidia bacterium]|nr:ATP-binding protein [Bacteroidia bacterium]